MEISIQSVLQSPRPVIQYDFREQIELPSEQERLVEPVGGELSVTRASSRIIQVAGDFHTRLLLVCDRCGNEFEFPVDFEVDETLEVTDAPTTSDEVEDKVFAQGHLDATDLIRQSLLLSLPPRRLCGCEPVASKKDSNAVDPRWAALKSLTVEPADSDLE